MCVRAARWPVAPRPPPLLLFPLWSDSRPPQRPVFLSLLQETARNARDLAAQNLRDAIKEVERIILQMNEEDLPAAWAGPGKVATAQADANAAVRWRRARKACVRARPA